MTVHVREMVVKVTLEDAKGGKAPSGGGGGNAKAELVETCVEQVLEILRQRMER